MTTDIATAILLLGDADPDVRIRAAMDLGTWTASESAPALVEQLGMDPSHNVRETLTWAILRMADAAHPHLLAALGSGRWLARLQACHVLSKLGDPADATALLPVIADPVDAVASRAWWAAGQTRADWLAGALVAQLGRGDSEVRNSLSIALDELGDAAVFPLVGALRTGETASVREHAADTLALLGSPRAEPAALALAEAVAGDEPRVRFAALNALGGLDSPLAWRAIRGACTDSDVRLAHLADRLLGARTAARDKAQTRRRRRPSPTPHEAAQPVGLVAAASGVLVELRCQTGFVAHGSTFGDLGHRIAEVAANLPVPDHDTVLAAKLGDTTVAETLADLSALTGERIYLGAVASLPGRTHSHLHADSPDLPPRIGALVGFEGDDPRIERKVVLQVATCDPWFVARSDVPEAIWAEVREAAEAFVAARGISDHLADRVIAGRLAAWATDHVLMDQVSITDPGVTINGLLYGRDVRITGFRRIVVGAGGSPAS